MDVIYSTEKLEGLEGRTGFTAVNPQFFIAPVEDAKRVYHQRPVTLSDVFIDPETRAIILVEPVYRGYVDVIEHTDGPQAAMKMKLESRALDNSRSGYRMRSNADQQLISPGDRGFEHAEVAGKQEIYWGRSKLK